MSTHTPGPHRSPDKTFAGPALEAAIVAFNEALALGGVRASTADVLVLLGQIKKERDELVSELVEALKRVEWTVQDVDGGAPLFCPSCEGHQPECACDDCAEMDPEGHMPNCALAAAIAKAEGR
jgi:hypothetical protein